MNTPILTLQNEEYLVDVIHYEKVINRQMDEDENDRQNFDQQMLILMSPFQKELKLQTAVLLLMEHSCMFHRE